MENLDNLILWLIRNLLIWGLIDKFDKKYTTAIKTVFFFKVKNDIKITPYKVNISISWNNLALNVVESNNVKSVKFQKHNKDNK